MFRAEFLTLVLLVSCGSESPAVHPNGVLREDGARDAEGREHGPWSYRYPNGELRESGEWDAGHRVGFWTEWFRNGQRRSHGERRWNPETGASERHGPWTSWAQNGVKQSRGAFEKGVREGPWRFWSDKGALDVNRSGVYANGVKIGPLLE